MSVFADASDAVKFVKSRVGLQSLNRRDDLQPAQDGQLTKDGRPKVSQYEVMEKLEGMAMRRYNALMLESDGHSLQEKAAYQKPAHLDESDLSTMNEIAAWASAGLAFPVGSCEVQSALAFAFLAEMGNTFPVFRTVVLGADHAFVVVGTGIDFAAPWRLWNSDTAAICDPWADYVSLCNPVGMQTWFEKLKQICPPPFEPTAKLSYQLKIASKGAWKYRITS